MDDEIEIEEHDLLDDPVLKIKYPDLAIPKQEYSDEDNEKKIDDEIEIEEHDVLDDPVLKSIYPDLTISKQEYSVEDNEKKIDDEIEIEEHDVLDDPVLKSIYPDLTISKQEYSVEDNENKIDDEIEIEEHDVLDDPVLKSIYPDLTKSKQEYSVEDNEKKIDDEIEIEEHDVLDDPVLKSIFPDLTISKQEYSVEDNEISTAEQNAPKDDIVPIMEYLTDEAHLSLEEYMDEIHNEYNSHVPFIGNKVILGSKPNKNKSNSNVCKNALSLYSTKVSLQNIKPYLDSCKRYCELCLILFPTEGHYKKHEKLYHLHAKEHKSKTNVYSEINTQTKNGTLNKCYICNSTFTRLSNLNNHIRHMHSTKNTKNKNVPKPVETCFHCNVTFSSMQSLIEHYYETLGYKNKEQEIENKDASNSENCKMVQKHDSKNFGKVISENKVVCSKESADFVYKCIVCCYRFKNVKILKRHMLVKHDIKDPGSPTKTLYNPKCNFCSSEFLNVFGYNAHIRGVHKKMVLSKISKKSIKPTSFRNHDKKAEKNVSDKTNSINKVNEEAILDTKENYVHCILKTANKTVIRNKDTTCDKSKFEDVHRLISEKNEMVQKQDTEEIKHFGKVFGENKIEQTQDLGVGKNVENVIIKKTVQKKDIEESNFEAFVYTCKVCSYHYINMYFLVRHMFIKHNIKNPIPPKNVLYDPKCKFCSSEFPNVIRHNEHIRNVHKKMFLSKISKRIVKRTRHPKIDKKSDKKVSVKTNLFNNNNDKDTSTILEAEQSHVKFILKSALFRCNRCDIQFLNSQVAIDHVSHMEMLINWKCLICKRIFKKNDETDHMLQHSVTNDFTVYGISESTPSLILYNCPKCNVHFDETKYLQHFPICETVSVGHVKCKFCGILIDSNLECLHNTHHERGHISKGFVIVKTDVIPNSLDLVSKTNEISNKDGLNKSVFKDVEHSISEKNEMVVPFTREIQGSNNINENLTINNEYLKTINVRNDTPVEDNKLFKVYYCKYCKCFVNEYTVPKHIGSKCKYNQKPTICVLCGLMYPQKNTSSHARLHTKKIDLTLQDFEFYDLVGKRLINPPFPEFPQCIVCEINFPRKNDKARHACGSEEYIVCSTCKLKFSELGYTLHMNYHNLTASHCNSLTDTTQISNTIMRNAVTNENILIFTCKHCHMSLSNYDLAIEHCQEHFISDEIKEPAGMCKSCNLVFDAKFSENHELIHLKNFDKNRLKTIPFDTIGFKTDYKAWMKKVFKCIPEAQMKSIVEKSIYENENKIKMEVIQEGSYNLKMYKCDNCNCFIDPQALNKHLGTDCRRVRKHTCKICFIPFISLVFKSKHEENHTRPFKGIKSYTIILFNRQEDETINSVLHTENCFIQYKCAKCNGIVNNGDQEGHVCNKKDLKICTQCGLSIYSKDFNSHLCKYEKLDTFGANNFKLVVFGEDNANEEDITDSNKERKKRKKYDYEIYKCKKCQLCTTDGGSSRKHVCSTRISKSICYKCGLYYERSKLRSHYALHKSDSNFVIANITVIDIDNTKTKNTDCNYVANSATNSVIESNKIEVTYPNEAELQQNTNSALKKIVTKKLYRCSCGLHFLDRTSASKHQATACGLKNKMAVRQECSKCGLSFNPNVLFNHLVKHHGNKEVTCKFDITDVVKNRKKTWK